MQPRDQDTSQPQEKNAVPPLKTSNTSDESQAKTPKSPSALNRVIKFFSPKDKPDKRKEKEKKHNEMVEQHEFERAFDRMMKDPANAKDAHLLSKKEFKRRSRDVSDLLRGVPPAALAPEEEAGEVNAPSARK